MAPSDKTLEFDFGPKVGRKTYDELSDFQKLRLSAENLHLTKVGERFPMDLDLVSILRGKSVEVPAALQKQLYIHLRKKAPNSSDKVHFNPFLDVLGFNQRRYNAIHKRELRSYTVKALAASELTLRAAGTMILYTPSGQNVGEAGVEAEAGNEGEANETIVGWAPFTHSWLRPDWDGDISCPGAPTDQQFTSAKLNIGTMGRLYTKNQVNELQRDLKKLESQFPVISVEDHEEELGEEELLSPDRSPRPEEDEDLDEDVQLQNPDAGTREKRRSVRFSEANEERVIQGEASGDEPAQQGSIKNEDLVMGEDGAGEIGENVGGEDGNSGASSQGPQLPPACDNCRKANKVCEPLFGSSSCLTCVFAKLECDRGFTLLPDSPKRKRKRKSTSISSSREVQPMDQDSEEFQLSTAKGVKRRRSSMAPRFGYDDGHPKTGDDDNLDDDWKDFGNPHKGGGDAVFDPNPSRRRRSGTRPRK